MNIKLLRISPNAKLPTKGTKGSAYYDLYAAENGVVYVNQVAIISTGWRTEIPEGYFLDIRPRSGLAVKGVTVNNSPGTVDADFRGELKVILINHGFGMHGVSVGDRIAQCALMPVIESDFSEVSDLSETVRGEGGYGSTGK